MLPAESGQLLSTIILSSGLLYEMVGPACAKASIKLSGSVPGKAAAREGDAGKASVGKAAAGKADAEKADVGKVIASSSSASGPDTAKADGVELSVHKAAPRLWNNRHGKKPLTPVMIQMIRYRPSKSAQDMLSSDCFLFIYA